MIYNFEKELQNDLQQLVSRFESDRLSKGFVRREVPVGRYVPDLIAVKFEKFPNIKTWPSDWSANYSFLISLLRLNSKLSIEDIARYYYCKPENVEPILGRLLKYRLIEKEKNYYRLTQDYLNMKVKVISFEAKLYRWREALNQAITYKSFSDKVIVAMDPEGIPKRKSSLLLFEENGIGLMAVNKTEINWIVYPQENNQLNDEYDYIITSTLVPKRQIFWSRLKETNAACQL